MLEILELTSLQIDLLKSVAGLTIGLGLFGVAVFGASLVYDVVVRVLDNK